jgi:hypothetical protein
MTYAEAKTRFEAIEAQENELYEMQYRFGYIADRQTIAKLYQEKQNLKKLFNIGRYDKF